MSTRRDNVRQAEYAEDYPMQTLSHISLTISSILLLSACAPTTTGGATRGQASAHDVDGDGLHDSVDKCPEDREDVDGFQDEDGCPDVDNDQDGVIDSMDRCPNEPMVRQPGVDPSRGQGCPDDLRPPTLIEGK